MDKLDEGLKTLLDLGQTSRLPDVRPGQRLSARRGERAPNASIGLLETLDEMGIELINEDEAESRLLASGDLDDEPTTSWSRSRRRRGSRAHARETSTRSRGGSTTRSACI